STRSAIWRLVELVEPTGRPRLRTRAPATCAGWVWAEGFARAKSSSVHSGFSSKSAGGLSLVIAAHLLIVGAAEADQSNARFRGRVDEAMSHAADPAEG